MRKKVVLFLIGIIFIVGLFLRIYKLGSVPVSLTIDEVAIGYNSYSILKTGKDEWGKAFPIAFRSVGDYKPPLLIYIMIPAISVFGLNEFGIRITIALIGALTVLVIFALVKKLTGNPIIALITSFSIAISPWHIRYSRSTFEAILALFLVLLGIFLFLKSISNRGKYLWLSGLAFVLSMYAYHSERVFTPILVLSLIIIFNKEIRTFWKQSLITLVLSLVVFLPLFLNLLTPEGRTRANVTFFTKDYEINRFLYKKNPSFPQNILDNNFLIATNFWFKRYLDYFDLNFLFVDGMGYTIPKAPDVGLLYIIELPFFLIGFYLIFIKQLFFEKKIRVLLFIWLLIGPIAASFANNAQHPLRSLTSIPVHHLLSAAGIWFIYEKLRSQKKLTFFAATLAITIYCVGYFMNLYFINFQYTYSEHLMDGWKQAAKYALNNHQNYNEVIIDPRFGTLGPETVGIPYMYLLVYGKIPPDQYQNDPRRKEAYDSSNFSNFTFRSIELTEDKDRKNTLFIGSRWVLPVEENQVLERFYLLNGKEILRAATVK